MFAMHFLFFLLTRVCDLYHKAAYFVLKLEWVNLLMSLSLSLRYWYIEGYTPLCFHSDCEGEIEVRVVGLSPVGRVHSFLTKQTL